MTAPTGVARLSAASVPLRLVRFAWDAVSGIARDFVWAAVRDGIVRVGGLSPATQAIVGVTGLLLLATVVAFAGGDVFRTGQELLAVPGGVVGRGSLVPRGLIPATFVVLAVGTALLLAGLLHAAWPARLAGVVFFTSVSLSFQGVAHSLVGADTPSWPGWIFLAGIPVFFAIRWRARPRPGLEFAVLFVCVAGVLLVAARALTSSDQFTGDSFSLRVLELVLGQLVGLAFPLLFLAGLGIIAFGAQASSWALGFLDRRVAQWAVVLGLALLALWRSRDLVREVAGAIGDEGFAEGALPYVGAAIGVGLVWGYWLLLTRVSSGRPGAAAGEDGVAFDAAHVQYPLGAAFAAVSLVLVPWTLALQILVSFGTDGGWFGRSLLEVVEFMGRDGFVTGYRIVLSILFMGAGVLAARRGHRAVGLFVGVVGVVAGYQELLFLGDGPQDRLYTDDPGAADLCWTALFVGAGALWTVRGRLTELRAERLFFLVLLTALLRQYAFIADPFAPLLGFAGVGFVVFGLVWGLLTGGGWANEDTARFPRSSRVFVFLGYSLFSLALLNWYSSSHNLGMLDDLTSGIAASGVQRLGYPLLYALFTLGFVGAVVNRPIDTGGAGAQAEAVVEETGMDPETESDTVQP